MNEKILLEINRFRELMHLDKTNLDALLNEQIAAALKTIAAETTQTAVTKYIRELIDSSIKNATESAIKSGKAIDPETFLKNNLDNVYQKIQTESGLKSAMSVGEKQRIEAQLRKGIIDMVNKANQDAPRKFAKNAVKSAQKNLADPLAQKSVQQGGKKTIGSGTKSTVNQEVKNAIESSVTSEVKSVGDAMKDLVKALTPKDGWKRIKEHFKRNYGKYITAAGVTALAVYFYFYGEDAEVPQDIEQYVEDTSGTGGGDSGMIPVEDGAYTTAGDPYQYKVIDGVWHTKGGRPPKVIQNWVSLANNTQAQDILDKRFPEARKKPTTTPEPNKPTPEAGKEEEVVADLGDF